MDNPYCSCNLTRVRSRCRARTAACCPRWPPTPPSHASPSCGHHFTAAPVSFVASCLLDEEHLLRSRSHLARLAYCTTLTRRCDRRCVHGLSLAAVRCHLLVASLGLTEDKAAGCHRASTVREAQRDLARGRCLANKCPVNEICIWSISSVRTLMMTMAVFHRLSKGTPLPYVDWV